MSSDMIVTQLPAFAFIWPRRGNPGPEAAYLIQRSAALIVLRGDTMHNGICPKCQGREVYEVVPKGQDGDIMLGVLARLPVRYMLCVGCGYMETYARNLSWAREAAKKGWRIGGEGRDGQ